MNRMPKAAKGPKEKAPKVIITTTDSAGKRKVAIGKSNNNITGALEAAILGLVKDGKVDMVQLTKNLNIEVNDMSKPAPKTEVIEPHHDLPQERC